MRAPADFTYAIPDALDSASAAPLLCAGITVYSPLRRNLAFPGQRVAVVGVGGLGHLALQFAAAMGAQVGRQQAALSMSHGMAPCGAWVVYHHDRAYRCLKLATPRGPRTRLYMHAGSTNFRRGLLPPRSPGCR
jgi:D-arabinose 1-dehydrogenase-like Zn-dependent alcohol dehydrogenase